MGAGGPWLPVVEALIFVHIGAGLWCLGAGPVAMLARPKGGAIHLRWGRGYVRGVAVVAATAGLLLCLRWSAFFFALSVLSFYLVFSGWRVLGRKQPWRGKEEQARPVDWCAAVATVLVGGLSVYLRARGVFGADAAVVLGTLGFAVGAAVYDLWRFARARRPDVRPGVWLLEHITKVSGSYIALASAFSGTVFTDLPVALAQTWPALVGVPLLLFVANRYWRKTRRTKATGLS